MSEPDRTQDTMQIDDFCLEVALILQRILNLPDRAKDNEAESGEGEQHDNPGGGQETTT